MYKLSIIIFFCLLIFFSGCSLQKSQFDYKGLLLELDENGNEIWRSYEYKDPKCLNKDIFGNRLIADSYTKNFFSLDKNNNINWIHFGDFPKYIERTDEGNYLLVSSNQKYKVYEVDEKGKFIKGLTLGYTPIAAHKLKNENYIVLQENETKLSEISPTEKELWAVDQDLLLIPKSLQVINNDTFIIADEQSHCLLNINRKTNKTEIIKRVNGINSAIKLKNGNYVYSDILKNQLVIINSKGEFIKFINGLNAEYITLLPDGNIGIAAKEYNKKNE